MALCTGQGSHVCLQECRRVTATGCCRRPRQAALYIGQAGLHCVQPAVELVADM